MVKVYKKKRSKTYDSETLQEALEKYSKAGGAVSLNSISKEYGIPESTLRRLKEKTKEVI